MSKPIRRQSRGLARERGILESAAEVIVAHGVAAATMSAVGNAAGVSPGTLYRFFSSSTEIVDALLAVRAAELAEHMSELGHPIGEHGCGTVAERLEALLRSLVDFYRLRPDFLILLDWARRHGNASKPEAELERHFLPVLADLLASPGRSSMNSANPSAIVALEIIHAIAARASTMSAKGAEPVLKVAIRALAALSG